MKAELSILAALVLVTIGDDALARLQGPTPSLSPDARPSSPLFG
jgi:hypothetical protein